MLQKEIAIVTDSTADLPLSLVEEMGIVVVPLNVILGEKNYKDGIDISSQEFFEMLPTTKVHPRTSQPSPGEFSEVYTKLLSEYKEIVSIHISSHLSGTYQSAVLASEMVDGGKITVVDSQGASLGLGLAVMEAARERNAGAKTGEIIAHVKAVSKNQVFVLSVENLVWLEKNGRIGKASSLLGSILNVHPILRVKDGAIVAHSKVRGSMSKVLKSLVEAAGEFVPYSSRVSVGILHGNCQSRAEELRTLVAEKYQIDEITINQIGPVIGVHVGPGTIGLVVVPLL